MSRSGNLFADLPGDATQEQFSELLHAPSVRIERIVSHGQASPPGFWYDQDSAEWVVVLSGSAVLLLEARRRRGNSRVAITSTFRRTGVIASKRRMRASRRFGLPCTIIEAFPGKVGGRNHRAGGGVVGATGVRHGTLYAAVAAGRADPAAGPDLGIRRTALNIASTDDLSTFLYSGLPCRTRGGPFAMGVLK